MQAIANKESKQISLLRDRINTESIPLNDQTQQALEEYLLTQVNSSKK